MKRPPGGIYFHRMGVSRLKRRRDSGQEKPSFVCLNLHEISAGPLPGRGAQDGPGIAQLAASIARQGLLSPIVVRRIDGAASSYQLICGARRLAACRMLGMKTIHARIVEGDEAKAAACYMEEHMTRLPSSAIEEAEMILDAGGMETAKESVLPAAQYERRLALLALDERTKSIAREAGMNLAQTEPLLLISREDLRHEAAELIAQRRLSGAQARRLVSGPQQRGEAGGRRSAAQDALSQVQQLSRRIQAQGIEAKVSVLSRNGDLTIQLTIGTKKDASKAAGKGTSKGE